MRRLSHSARRFTPILPSSHTPFPAVSLPASRPSKRAKPVLTARRQTIVKAPSSNDLRHSFKLPASANAQRTNGDLFCRVPHFAPLCARPGRPIKTPKPFKYRQESERCSSEQVARRAPGRIGSAFPRLRSKSKYICLQIFAKPLPAVSPTRESGSFAPKYYHLKGCRTRLKIVLL